jgi:hypothetical protein
MLQDFASSFALVAFHESISWRNEAAVLDPVKKNRSVAVQMTRNLLVMVVIPWLPGHLLVTSYELPQLLPATASSDL